MKLCIEDIADEVRRNYQFRYVGKTGSAFFEKTSGEQVTKTRSLIQITFKDIEKVVRGKTPRLKLLKQQRYLDRASRAETEEQIRYRKYLECCERLKS